MSLCEAERHDEARAAAAESFAWGRELPRDSSLLPNLGALAIVAAELADRAEAAWLYDALLPFEAWWATWGAQGALAPVATLLGRLRATLGDPAEADAHFDRAVVHCRDQQSAFFLTDALLHQATARLAAGADADAAVPLLEESLALARAGRFGRIERRASAALAASAR